MAQIYSIDFADDFSERAFEDPQEVGCFSVDSMEVVHYDRSELRFYIPRSEDDLPIDLNKGHVNVNRAANYDGEPNLDRMLRWIQKTDFEALKCVDFVGSRSYFAKLCCSPSISTRIKNDNWIFSACRLDGIIYLKWIDTRGELPYTWARMASWGINFPAYMTSDSPDGIPDVWSTIPDIEKFHILVKNKIGKHVLLMRAVVDAVEASGQKHPEDTSCYVEMKMCKINDENPPPVIQHLFRKKTLSWWAECYVTGIKKVVCGYRDNTGIIHAVQEYSTEELPNYFESEWSTKTCLGYCNEFLNFLKRTVTEDNHRIVYRIEFLEGRNISVLKLEDPEEKYQIIPDWYAEELRKKKQAST